jgi:DNA-binding NtrC family response regulator
VRIVSATNRDLIADVKAGRFREDLFYRLHVFPVTVPPLRRRPEDIAPLTRHFLARFAAEEGKRVRAVSAEAMGLLSGFRWPGNVRQLENAVFRAVVLAEGEEIGADEFPQVSALIDSDAAPTQPALPPQPVLLGEWPGEARNAAPATLRLTDPAGHVRPLEEIEREAIRFAIAHHEGQMSEVARRLKIGRSTLYRKLESLGLDDGAPVGEVA